MRLGTAGCVCRVEKTDVNMLLAGELSGRPPLNTAHILARFQR